jgi:hypothetical protein
MRRTVALRLARAVPLAAAIALPCATGVPAAAQQPRPRVCLVHIDTAGTTNIFQPRPGAEQVYAGSGVRGRCLNDPTRMNADSLTWAADRGELQLIGRVHFEDSLAILDADRVTYWVRQERLYAEGSVYTRNRASGSELRGPNLDYYRAVPPLRDTLELRGSGRPTIHVRPVREGAASDTSEPFVVVADRVWMRGTQRMWGHGRVTIDRSDLAARGDTAILDLADSVGFLSGAPVVTGRDTAQRDSAATYRLTGNRIRFDLTGTQDIRRVLSSGTAEARGPDWLLQGDTIDLALDSSRIERAQAWGRTRRALATADLSTITADSLDIRMPGQVMEQVWAWGTARAASRPDSAQPEDDWLTGDTLRARFRPVTDSLGRRRSEIERVAAFGAARALYHVENDRDPAGPRGVNYSRGHRIEIALEARRVRQVDIVGQVDGVYLEPAPEDSLAADSAAAGDTTGAVRRARPRPAPGTPGRPAPAPRPAGTATARAAEDRR